MLLYRHVRAIAIVPDTDEKDTLVPPIRQVVGERTNRLTELAAIRKADGSFHMIGFALAKKPPKFVIRKHYGFHFFVRIMPQTARYVEADRFPYSAAFARSVVLVLVRNVTNSSAAVG